MLAEGRFARLPKGFWAAVRILSQVIGYTQRGTGRVKTPSLAEIVEAYRDLQLDVAQVADGAGRPTQFGELLVDYFTYRARVLNEYVEPRLMDKEEAEALYNTLRERVSESCPLPHNKQKGRKRGPAYFACMVNLLIAEAVKDSPCDFDPRGLILVERNGIPIRTLGRRFDGAFPSVRNPIAVWEIKEYYNTTTFGSRVADGIYETLLDGMELRELESHVGIHIQHVLMIDSRYTWWECGRSYLCRLVDILNMGFVDEVLFGREILERLPRLAHGWLSRAKGGP